LFQVAEANKASMSITARALIQYTGVSSKRAAGIVAPTAQTSYDMAVDVAIQPVYVKSDSTMKSPLAILLMVVALVLWV